MSVWTRGPGRQQPAVVGTRVLNVSDTMTVRSGGRDYPFSPGPEPTQPAVIFPTTTFAVFFCIVLVASWLLMPHPRFWRLFIIGASFVFYADWNWKFVGLLAFSILWNQAIGLGIHRAGVQSQRQLLLTLGVVVDVGLLGYFKYYDFFVSSGHNVFSDLGLGGFPLGTRSIVLPVGISFFTFMAISYIVDIYRRELEPASLAKFGAYLSFFPHLVAGPIVRGSELLPQLETPRDPRQRRHEPRLLPDRHRPVQEGRDRELPGDAHRRPGLRRPGPALVARDVDRRLRLRRADLRRLLRLHGHGHRHRAPARLQVPAELRQPVHRRLDPGLLAPLAHDALALAARLRLHPPRREPEGRAADLPEPDGDDADRRPLARRRVVVRDLGRPPRRLARDRPVPARARARDRRRRPAGRCGVSGSSPSTSSASPGSSSAPARRTGSRPPGRSSAGCSTTGAPPRRSSPAASSSQSSSASAPSTCPPGSRRRSWPASPRPAWPSRSSSSPSP